jgi:hypothetical protein
MKSNEITKKKKKKRRREISKHNSEQIICLGNFCREGNITFCNFLNRCKKIPDTLKYYDDNDEDD